VEIGDGAGGLLPKEISFRSQIPQARVLEDRAYAKDRAYHQLRRRGEATPEAREMMDRAYDVLSADTLKTSRKVAVPMIRAVERIVKADMASRSPFALWSPQSGYRFYGAANDMSARASRTANARDAIYAKLLARNKHPDYFVQSNGHNVYLRRRFPFRHEVAAGAAAGVLFPGTVADGKEHYGVSPDREFRAPLDAGLTPAQRKALALALDAEDLRELLPKRRAPRH
jgi:hypothetical protein